MIEDDLGKWRELPFFDCEWQGIKAYLAAENREILPPKSNWFAALQHLQPNDVRVVILGQDPYPTPGHANGLAFSVAPHVVLPKSLKNIFKEMESDLGGAPNTGDLTHWARQGVLLLNTALTVPAGNAGGHSSIGWHVLAEQILRHLSDEPRAFVLWGNHARGLKSRIGGNGHLFIESPHPSPLAAYRGFFQSRPFSRINQWLEAQGERQIDWIGNASLNDKT